EPLQVVPDGDLAGLPALLGKPKTPLRPVVLKVAEPEPAYGADAGGGVDEDGDHGPVAQATAWLLSMDSSSLRACSAVISGVFPPTTSYRSARTESAGLRTITWRVTSRSKNLRMAARASFLVGTLPGC